jgi:heat shock protein HslJ
MKHVVTMVLVGLIVVACAVGMPSDPMSQSKDPQMVLGRTWQWVATITPAETVAVAAPARYTILLLADGKAQVRFDCNRGGGEYTIADGALSFGPLISTRMACPPDTQDALFMRDLSRVRSFVVESGQLNLELPADNGSMRFRQAP